MTNKRQPQIFLGLIICAVPVVAIVLTVLMASADWPRLEKTKYHWTSVSVAGWIYAPEDVKVSRDSGDGPLGTLEPTDDGAWKAKWRWKPCGAGEYLSWELAEKCVENAAENDGFFGYHLVMPRQHRAEHR